MKTRLKTRFCIKKNSIITIKRFHDDQNRDKRLREKWPFHKGPPPPPPPPLNVFFFFQNCLSQTAQDLGTMKSTFK